MKACMKKHYTWIAKVERMLAEKFSALIDSILLPGRKPRSGQYNTDRKEYHASHISISLGQKSIRIDNPPLSPRNASGV
jgi:hypothetical protein